MSKIKKPIYGPPEIDEAQMTEREVALAKRKETLHKIRERKIRRAFRALRLRGLKNFLFWFFGVFSSIAIILGSVFVGVKVIPVSTYMKWAGQDSAEIVSDKISEKSLFDAIMGLSDYTFGDVPMLGSLVENVLAETGVDDFVIVDYDALENVKFMNASEGSDLIDEISKCIKFNSEIDMFKNIKAFSEYQDTTAPIERNGDTWVIKEGVSLSHYCYVVAPATGGQPMNKVYSENTEVTYADVFVNGQLADALKNLTPAQMEQVQFCYKPLSKLPLLDIVNDLNMVLGRVEITDILSIVGNGGAVDPLLTKLLGGKSIGNLISDLDVSGFLDNLMISDLGNIEEIFGDLGGLSVFSSWQEVPEKDKPELDANNKIIYKEGTEEFTANPGLYYYLTSGTHGEEDAVYELAFDKETGVRKEGVDDYTQLYYPNLAEISFSSAFDVIGESIGTLEITDLLGTFIPDLGEGDLVYEILVGTSIKDLGTNFDAGSIMSKITLDTIGGAESLGDLGELLLYSGWREVNDKPQVIDGVIADLSDASAYYYLASGTHGTNSANYMPAFNNETGKRVESLDDETALYYKSGWELVPVSDKPVTETVGENTVITKDGDKFTLNPKLFYYLPSNAKEFDEDAYVRAFDDDGVRAEAVTDDTDLFYVNIDAVMFDQVIEIIGDSIGRKRITSLLENFGATFDEDSLISNILGDKTINQVGDINADSIKLTGVMAYEGNEEMYEIILSAVGKLPTRETEDTDQTYDAKVKQAAEEMTIGSLGDLSSDNINLDVVLPEENNEQLYQILRSAKNLEDDEPITVGTLNGLDIEAVNLTIFFEYEGNEEMYEIILSAVGKLPTRETEDTDQTYDAKVKTAAENLTLGQLDGFDSDDINLEVVLPEKNNEKLYKLLRSANNMPDGSTITVGELNGLDVDDIQITTLFEYEGNEQLFEILLSAVTVKNAFEEVITNPAPDDLRVGHLSSFNQNNIELNVVLPEANNEKLYSIIRSAKGLPLAYSIKIGDLNGMNIDNAQLSAVLDAPTENNDYKNKDLYDILLQALTVKDLSGHTISNPTAKDIRIGHLSSFSTNGIKLSTVLKGNVNEKLKDVLVQASNKSYDSIVLSDLSSPSFDIGNVKLNSVMTKTSGTYGNDILDALLDGENGDTITINNIGQKIGGLSLYEVYGKDCFTTNFNDSVDKQHGLTESTARLFAFDQSIGSKGAFVHATSTQFASGGEYEGKEKYYLHRDDGIWLFICFESQNYKDKFLGGIMYDSDGRPEQYVVSENTLNSLKDASIFKSLFSTITIRQFVDSGVIEEPAGGYNEAIYILNVSGVLDALNDKLS